MSILGIRLVGSLHFLQMEVAADDLPGCLFTYPMGSHDPPPPPAADVGLLATTLLIVLV